MTLEEAIQAANGGDVEAMKALGNYYYEQKEFSDASEWWDKAVECGDIRTALVAGGLHSMMGGIYADGMAQFKMAIPEWETARKYCQIILNHSNQFSENEITSTQEDLAKAAYGLGYSFYYLHEYQQAADALSDFTDSDERCRFLFGMVLWSAYEDKVAGAREAYQYIQTVESSTLDIEPDLIYEGSLTLALIYRSAHLLNIPGVQTDIERAYHCVQRAASLPGEIGQSAAEELKKYRQGFFGGYTYQG